MIAVLQSMVGTESAADRATAHADAIQGDESSAQTNRDAGLVSVEGELGEILVLTVKVLGSLSSDDASIRMSVEAGLLSGLGAVARSLRIQQLAVNGGVQTELITIVHTIATTLLSLVTRAGRALPLSHSRARAFVALVLAHAPLASMMHDGKRGRESQSS